MTTAEALAIAAQAKPIRRQPLDKLHGTVPTTFRRLTATAKS